MSGHSPHGAGSCSVSSALSANRPPNYRALPATPNSCRLRCCPLPGVLTASLGLEHLLPLPDSTRWLSRERPALVLPYPGVQLRCPLARPGIREQCQVPLLRPFSPIGDYLDRALSSF